MVENYDLKTVQTEINDTIVDLITGEGATGDKVPENMKRYVTYIKYCNTRATAQTITVADGAAANALTSRQDKQKLAAGDTIMFPDSPNPEAPIMSVDGEHYLTAQAEDAADGIDVTFQYYDK